MIKASDNWTQMYARRIPDVKLTYEQGKDFYYIGVIIAGPSQDAVVRGIARSLDSGHMPGACGYEKTGIDEMIDDYLAFAGRLSGVWGNVAPKELISVSSRSGSHGLRYSNVAHCMPQDKRFKNLRDKLWSLDAQIRAL